jgi:hypothetical protein
MVRWDLLNGRLPVALLALLTIALQFARRGAPGGRS